MIQGASVANLHANSVNRWTKLAAIMPILKKAGLKRVRVDCAYAAVFAASGEVEDVSTVTTYFDTMATTCGSNGIEVFLVLHLVCENRAAWRNAFNGGVAWDTYYRPPIGVGGALARAAGRTGARYANAIKAKYVAAGGLAKNFHVLYCNEPAVGLAGFPNGEAQNYWMENIEDYNDGEFTGTWDTTYHWSHTTGQDPKGWLDLLEVAPTQPVTGWHDWLEVVTPEFMDYLDDEVQVHFPCFGSEVIQTELDTFMPAGYTWYEHPRLKTDGRYNLTMNCYRGYLAGIRSNSPKKIAQFNAQVAVDTRAAIAAHMGGLDKFNLLYTEWGVTQTWMIGDSTVRRDDQYLRGRIIDETANLLDSLGFKHFMFTLQGWDSSVDPYALLNSSDVFTGAIRPVMVAGGHTATTAPDGSSYSYGAAVGTGSIHEAGAAPA